MFFSVHWVNGESKMAAPMEQEKQNKDDVTVLRLIPCKTAAGIDDSLASPAHWPQQIGQDLMIQAIPNPLEIYEQLFIISRPNFPAKLPL